MLTPLDERCDEIVADLKGLGAKLFVENRGMNGGARWNWTGASAASARSVLVYLESIEDVMGYVAFEPAMVKAIERAKAE